MDTQQKIIIAPSLLSADFAKLAQDIRVIEEAGANWLHIDVMDGHFVPNITIGPLIVKAIRRITKLPLDVHLMINNPDEYLGAFHEAGADIISVHVEICTHLDRTLCAIRQLGLKASVALNPATSVSLIENVLNIIDMVVVMSVNPGFGGQKFIPQSLQKIKQLREMANQQNPSLLIEVDGGINLDTYASVLAAGANILVAGSAIFGANDRGFVIRSMKNG